MSVGWKACITRCSCGVEEAWASCPPSSRRHGVNFPEDPGSPAAGLAGYLRRGMTRPHTGQVCRARARSTPRHSLPLCPPWRGGGPLQPHRTPAERCSGGRSVNVSCRGRAFNCREGTRRDRNGGSEGAAALHPSTGQVLARSWPPGPWVLPREGHKRHLVRAQLARLLLQGLKVSVTVRPPNGDTGHMTQARAPVDWRPLVPAASPRRLAHLQAPDLPSITLA